MKAIIVVPYNPQWPTLFEAEAAKIRAAVGERCLAIHHVGSTSVPGLKAKPIIDMIGVIEEPERAIAVLESLGFTYKGDYNIPMRLYFNRCEGVQVNLHVYEPGHAEIDLNLLFRDYLRAHPALKQEYAALKENLLKDPAAFEKKNSLFTGYNLGKDAFIRKVLQLAHFTRLRMVKCAHYVEWDRAKQLRNCYFFAPKGMIDPYSWSFDHRDHLHLIFYQGVEMAGYAHIQRWSDHRAALRIFVIDEPYQHRALGSYFLQLCERWLKKQGVYSLHSEVRAQSASFYRKNGYVERTFEDPSGELTSPQDIAMAKDL